jgi:hypothetical protein
VAAETAHHTWTCPSCGRHVPRRSDTCHCGLSRARAEELAAAAPVPARPRPPRVPAGRREIVAAMPRDVKTLLVVGALVVVAGLAWLLVAPPLPPAAPAVLGYVDASPPPPPRKTPPPEPPFKLPWWK